MTIKNILCFGDSLTEGWINGGNSFHPYTVKLQALLDEKQKNAFKVINKGLSGELVYMEMYKRLQEVLKSLNHVDLLVLQGGTNDILLLNQLQDDLELFDEFQKLFEIAKSNNVKKICLLTTMEGYYIKEYDAVMSHQESNKLRLELNEKLCDYANANQDLFILCDIAKELPFFDLDDNETKIMWDDKIHPSINGYDRMAEIIYDHVKEFL